MNQWDKGIWPRDAGEVFHTVGLSYQKILETEQKIDRIEGDMM